MYESTFAEASTRLIPSAFYILLVPVLLWQHPSRLLSLIIPSKVNLSTSFTSHNYRWVVAHYSYHPTFILPPRSILFNLCRLIYRGRCRIAPAPPPLSHLSMLSHAISRSQGPCPAPPPLVFTSSYTSAHFSPYSLYPKTRLRKPPLISVLSRFRFIIIKKKQKTSSFHPLLTNKKKKKRNVFIVLPVCENDLFLEA